MVRPITVAGLATCGVVVFTFDFTSHEHTLARAGDVASAATCDPLQDPLSAPVPHLLQDPVPQGPAPRPTPAASALDWHTDLGAAEQLAAQRGDPLLIVFR